ncbi:hypothetical protein P7C73_g5129, partial [Tremellales sp. Uapishka_1]
MASIPTRPQPLRANRPASTTAPSSSSRVASNASGKEPVHLPLYRRLLFPYESGDAEIKGLIRGRGDQVDEIDARLHHLIALALRAYILSWYTAFSPRDKTFLPHVQRNVISPLLSPILNDLYADPSRILHLVLLDLPTILRLHIRTYWEARASSSLRGTELGAAYHARLPLLAVDAEQGTLDPLYLGALVDALLKSHLPAKDYAASCEKLMIREVVARSILASVGRRLSQNWFWWQILLRVMGEPGAPPPLPGKQTWNEMVSRWIALLLQLFSTVTWLFALYTACAPPLPTFRRCHEPWVLLTREMLGVDGRYGIANRSWGKRLLWGSIEITVDLFAPVLDRFVVSSLRRLETLTHWITRIVPHLIETHFLTPETSLKLIDTVETILFPDGYPGPSPSDPSAEETAELGVRVDRRLAESLPPFIKKSFFPRPTDVAALVDPLDDTACTAHLVAMVLDATVAAILPAMVLGQPVVGSEKEVVR